MNLLRGKSKSETVDFLKLTRQQNRGESDLIRCQLVGAMRIKPNFWLWSWLAFFMAEMGDKILAKIPMKWFRVFACAVFVLFGIAILIGF